MFESFPETCRNYGVNADVRALLTLRRGMEAGLVHTLGDLYAFFKGVIVKDPEQIGPYSQAFYDYFVGIEVGKGERLSDAINRSDAFRDWLDDFFQGNDERRQLSPDELIDRFLDEIHMTTYDIQKVLDGETILAEDNPQMSDREGGNADQAGERLVDRAADYRFVDLEELRERMERVLEQQMTKHEGGSHWIGTGGISPYGHSGAALGGIRTGGSGGGRMAREVIDNPNYYPVDIDANINDDNVDAALASLKGILQETNDRYLDIPLTVKEGVAQGGLFLPVELDKTEDRLQVMLLIDNGGYSMDYHIRPVQSLFKKMKTRYAHDLETYYFHNTIYGSVYEDVRRTRAVPIERLLAKESTYRVFVIGDAAMAPYEFNEQSMLSWGRLQEKFTKMAWLNPIQSKYWSVTWTTTMIRRIVSMYEMTPRGIAQAIEEMNRNSKI